MHEALRHFNIFLKIKIFTSAIINSLLLRLICLFSLSLNVIHTASMQDVSSASPTSLFL